MKVFINELSFPNRTENPEEVSAALEALVLMSDGAKRLCNHLPIRRDRELKNREVMPGISLGQFIINLGKNSDPKKRDLKSVFLRAFANGPFFEGFHQTAEVKDIDGNCLKNTCFDDATESKTGSAVISAYNFPRDSILTIFSTKFGTRKILNLTSASQIEENIWVYQANAKHEIGKDYVVAGETWSAMTLSTSEAQKLLSNGIKCGKSVFNKIGDQWYKFHCHEKNLYHGFPINVKTPYKDYSNAYQISEKIGKNIEGQIIAELIEIVDDQK